VSIIGSSLHPTLLLVNFSIAALLSAGLLTLFVILSAFVSCAETALFSISPADKHTLKVSNQKKDQNIAHLFDNSKHLLASLLVANNFFNMSIIVLSAFITSKFINASSHPTLTFLVQVVAVTLLLLLVCDTVPKAYATGHALKVTRTLLFFIYIIRALFYPFASLLVLSTSFMDKYILGKKSVLSTEDLSEALEITAREMPHGDRKILKDIIQLGSKDVKEIMQPRIDIVSFDESMRFDELLKKAVDCGFSRIPIFKDSLDNIIGILYTKDLIAYTDQGAAFAWKSLLHRVFYVPESKKTIDLLEEFREKKIHLAIVVDEFGSTSGIVSLEDIVEEILGEIRDELDEDTLVYSKLDDQNYVFEGKVSLGDFCRITEVDPAVFQEQKGGSDTLGGFLTELSGRIPEKKEKLIFANLEFIIEVADKRMVKRVKVTIGKKVEVPATKEDN
jgi:gliding motility-associated protein GldE